MLVKSLLDGTDLDTVEQKECVHEARLRSRKDDVVAEEAEVTQQMTGASGNTDSAGAHQEVRRVDHRHPLTNFRGPYSLTTSGGTSPACTTACNPSTYRIAATNAAGFF